jgi:ribosome maturation factor RimP
MKKEAMLEKVMTIVRPIVENLNYDLYHLEYVKENNEFYLRIYIDSTNGISLEDCERVSRAVSEALDVNDPINDAYYLEVLSPGIYRELHTDEHLFKYKGSEVVVNLKTSFNGKKVIKGILDSHTNIDVTVLAENKPINVPREKIKTINLDGEL